MDHRTCDRRQRRTAATGPETVAAFDMFGACHEVLWRVAEDRATLARKRLPDGPHDPVGVVWRWPAGTAAPVPLRTNLPRPVLRRAPLRTSAPSGRGAQGLGAPLLCGLLGAVALAAVAAVAGGGLLAALLAWLLGGSVGTLGAATLLAPPDAGPQAAGAAEIPGMGRA